MKNHDLFNDYSFMIDKIIDKHFYEIKDKNRIKQEGYISLFKALDNKEIYNKKTFINYINRYMFFAILHRCALYIEEFPCYQDRVIISNLLINNSLKHTNEFPNITSFAKEYSISKKTAMRILMYSYNDFDEINIKYNDKRCVINLEELLVDKLDNRDKVNDILKNVSSEERKTIIIKQFGLEHGGVYTFQEIGDYLGVSKQSVNSRAIREMEKLRKNYKNTLQKN